jgi:hypothetical protein
VLAVIVVAVLGYVFYKNVIPVPDYPLNLMPWIFIGLVALGFVWYAVMRVGKPQLVEEVGSFEEEPVAPGAVHGHLADHAHPPRHGHRPPEDGERGSGRGGNAADSTERTSARPPGQEGGDQPERRG